MPNEAVSGRHAEWSAVQGLDGPAHEPVHEREGNQESQGRASWMPFRDEPEELVLSILAVWRVRQHDVRTEPAPLCAATIE